MCPTTRSLRLGHWCGWEAWLVGLTWAGAAGPALIPTTLSSRPAWHYSLAATEVRPDIGRGVGGGADRSSLQLGWRGRGAKAGQGREALGSHLQGSGRADLGRGPSTPSTLSRRSHGGLQGRPLHAAGEPDGIGPPGHAHAAQREPQRAGHGPLEDHQQRAAAWLCLARRRHQPHGAG